MRRKGDIERKKGAPPKLTPERHASIMTYMRRGNYRETACAAAGVNPKTMRNWLKRGYEGEEPYATFARDMDAAEAEAEMRHFSSVDEAGDNGDWRAAAWILARKYTDRWGERTEQVVTHKEAKATPEEAARLMAEKFGKVSRGTPTED